MDVRITAETGCRTWSATASTSRIRHGPASLAGPNAMRLFGEKVFPVCSPKLLKKNAARASPRT